MKATAPVLVQCSECDGEGRVMMPFGPEDEMDWVTCGLCAGEGEISEDRADWEGDDLHVSAPYDYPPSYGLTSAQIVALKADALRFAVVNNAPLIDPFTGRTIDQLNCPDAA